MSHGDILGWLMLAFRIVFGRYSDGLRMVFKGRLKTFRGAFGWVAKLTIYCRFFRLGGQLGGQLRGSK